MLTMGKGAVGTFVADALQKELTKLGFPIFRGCRGCSGRGSDVASSSSTIRAHSTTSGWEGAGAIATPATVRVVATPITTPREGRPEATPSSVGEPGWTGGIARRTTKFGKFVHQILLPEGGIQGLGQHDLDGIGSDLGVIQLLDGFQGSGAVGVMDKAEIPGPPDLLDLTIFPKNGEDSIFGGIQRKVAGKDDLDLGHNIRAGFIAGGGPITGADLAPDQNFTLDDLLKGGGGGFARVIIHKGKTTVFGHISRIIM